MNIKDETRKWALLYAAYFTTLEDTDEDKDFKTAMERLNHCLW